MEYSYLLDLADECEDPHMRLVYAGNIFRSLPIMCIQSLYDSSDGQSYFLQLLGSYLYILPSKGPGSHLIQFLAKHMKWSTMVELLLLQSRWSLNTTWRPFYTNNINSIYGLSVGVVSLDARSFRFYAFRFFVSCLSEYPVGFSFSFYMVMVLWQFCSFWLMILISG